MDKLFSYRICLKGCISNINLNHYILVLIFSMYYLIKKNKNIDRVAFFISSHQSSDLAREVNRRLDAFVEGDTSRSDLLVQFLINLSNKCQQKRWTKLMYLHHNLQLDEFLLMLHICFVINILWWEWEECLERDNIFRQVGGLPGKK